ncbi:Protein Skeletor, isoforms D/E [Araneus ventricosus]|uniref:Protein Skeletor, isoforms D/E n=1 Tax=Araneus ventricosus TaxID=182803 RepID=A0A4Y2B1H7_ARAVE|nr:Protein Skeletor, isoforms D/E [Araneus ventricosus]
MFSQCYEIFFLLFWATVLAVFGRSLSAPYFGSEIGTFKTFAHDVVGKVHAVDDRTLFIKGFSYDGQGPDAYFMAGSTAKPDATGFIIPDEKGKKVPLAEYRNKDILLRLPAGKTLRNIKWISVWCRKFSANFGEVTIPTGLVIPRPVEIGRIPTLEHGVSSGPVLVVDTQTLLVPDFTYDGLGPAAYWWVSRGARQHPRGLRLADENGSFAPLPKYTGKTVVITLPPEYTIYDFDWFGVWCEEARVDFGSVRLAQDLVVPPSPRTLGIELEYKLNCEVLRDDLGYEIRWIMDGEDIVMQLVARLEPNEYMSFGLSKNDTKSQMEKADAIVAWVDKRGKGHAQDYYLGSKEQCVGRRGSCPDSKFPDGTDSVTLLNAARVNGYTMITIKRPQVGVDQLYDQHVYSDGPQAVIWAVGPLNDKNEVSYHGILRSEGDVYIDFARSPQWNCPQPADYEPEPEFVPVPPTTTTTPAPVRKPTKRKPTTPAHKRKPQPVGSRYSSRSSDVRSSESKLDSSWNVPPIVCPGDKTFRAQIGPAGGKEGFQAITGLLKFHPKKIVELTGKINDNTYDVHTDGSRINNETGFAVCIFKNNEPYKDFLYKLNPTNSVFQAESATIGFAAGWALEHNKLLNIHTDSQSSIEAIKSAEPQSEFVNSIKEKIYSSRLLVSLTWVKGHAGNPGLVGWGIAWYVNGILIPELTLERGQTYTFVVEGGNDPENPARTHPFYITDDPEGGFEHKTPAEKKKVKVFAGASVDRRGKYTPTAKGRLCEWKLPQDMRSTDFETFDEFQQNLELKCERGKPARFTFKPDRNTPDLLYYQCYTHRHLGWKIHIVDSCDGLRPAASIQHVRNVTYNSLASDFKRGGEKKKLFSEEEVQFPRNDGIPLLLEEDSDPEPESQRETQHTSQAYKPTTSSAKSSVYFKVPTPPQEKKVYFVTTPRPKVESKYNSPRPPKVVTMETFQLRDVIPSIRQRGNYPSHRTIADQMGRHVQQQYRPQFSEIKNTLQWWNDPSKSQVSPTPIPREVRQKVTVHQRPTPENVPQRYPSQRPQGGQNKVISLVVNSGSNRFQTQGSSPGHTFALVNGDPKNLVPLLVVQPKQSTGHRNDGPRHTQRTKGGNEYIAAASQKIVRHAHPSNGSIQFETRKVPLVPVVVENNGNNFYSLQKVLSLLNNGGVIHTRGTRSADHHPDHHGDDHHNHHGHDHENHDHSHKEMDHKKKSSQKSFASSLSASFSILFVVCISHIFLRRT